MKDETKIILQQWNSNWNYWQAWTETRIMCHHHMNSCVTMGWHMFPSKVPLPMGISGSHLMHGSLDQLNMSQSSKRHLDQFGHFFCRAHPCAENTQTDHAMCDISMHCMETMQPQNVKRPALQFCASHAYHIQAHTHNNIFNVSNCCVEFCICFRNPTDCPMSMRKI